MRYPTLMSTVEGVYLTNATKAWMLPQAASTLKLYIDSWLMSRFSFDVLQGYDVMRDEVLQQLASHMDPSAVLPSQGHAQGAKSGPRPAGDDVLSTARANIDAIDMQLLGLLNARAIEVLAVGRYKQEHGLKVTDPAREARVVQGLQRRNVGPLFNSSVARLWPVVFEEMKRLE
mmetsp:Transcript_2190/g.3509  ORF Transcript_2190/g.3509 Transcript_2190/m.3509 type:complete len:174 (+) Transcript_2190:6-527(+)